MSTLPPPADRPADRPSELLLWRGEAEGKKRVAADKPGEILRLLSRAWRNVALYGVEHPVAQTAINDLCQFLQEAWANRASFRLFMQEDTFFEGERLLLEETLRFYSLLIAFKERLIGAVQVNAGVEPWELKHFIEVLNMKTEELERRGGAEAYLRACKVEHITVGSAIIAGSAAAPGAERAGPEKPGGEGVSPAPLRTAQAAPAKVDPRDAYRAGLRVMDELSYQASVDLPLNLAKARKVVNYFIDILGDERAALLGITALKNYDEDTYHHSINVCILSLLLGSQLNMDRTLLVTLGLAGLLHDIGKVRIPRNIITKPAKLTPEEMEIVKRHTIYGAHILRELPDLSRLAMVVAFEHHARYDLTGYPRVTGKKIPHLLTRIVFVADCFDAMTTARRAYRNPKGIDESLREIFNGAGTEFDPLLAKLFCKYCRAFLIATGDDKLRLESPDPAAAAASPAGTAPPQ